MLDTSACVVLFSGGQDSTTCLFWAIQKFKKVYPILFHYGQKHDVELKQAEKILKIAQLEPIHVQLNIFSDLGGNALTSDIKIQEGEKMPNTFVPGRNLLFLNYAAIYAYQLNAKNIVGGMCQTDYSGYPDCRRDFIDSTEQTLSLALDRPIKIHTPLMFLNKAETWLLAKELGILKIVVEESHTCYNGNRNDFYEWGFGCNDCPACKLRANGFYDAFKK